MRSYCSTHGLTTRGSFISLSFILCTEALIANVKKAERERILTGMKVARACPPISHLLFTDDSFFFCKAKREECQAILRILKHYEVVSDQQNKY